MPDWGVHKPVDLDAGPDQGLDAAVALIRRELGLKNETFALTVRARVPRAMGLGSSASLAVAITRALAEALGAADGDSILAHYVVTELPNGVSGVIIAAIFAADSSQL